MVQEIAQQLIETVAAAAEFLHQIDDADAARRPAPGKWSKKELLGHLLDSATNNNHRFVRVQQVDEFTFPHYEQEHWVRSQGYADRSWPELIELWRLFNRHLADVMVRIPEKSLAVSCVIGPYPPESMGDIVKDYIEHLRHHPKQMGWPEEVESETS